MAAPQVGDTVENFTLPDQDGNPVSLTDFRGKPVVLFFYPRDFTRICTAEVCGFRDMYEDMAGGDTEVIGVSLNDADSHKKFAEMHKVPYPLVADTDKVVAKAYGAVGALRGILGMAYLTLVPVA